MKTGRVIGGDEHDARVLAHQIVADARAEAEQLREAARADAARLRRDADELTQRLVQDARTEAGRTIARAEAEAARLRDTAQVAAHHRALGERDGSAITAASPAHLATGSVDEVIGLVMRATVPGVALGEIVRVDRRDREPLAAEVVGFRGEQAVLLPLGEVAGVAPAGAVWRTGAPLSIRCGDDLLGRV